MIPPSVGRQLLARNSDCRFTIGIILDANDRYCAMLGRSRNGLIGVEREALTHPDDVRDNALELERMNATKQTRVLIKEKLKDRTNRLRTARNEVLNALVVAAQFRDLETGNHLQRTKKYVQLLLESLPGSRSFSRHGIRQIAQASMLRDIGKVGIPDSVLLKKDSLDRDEIRVMRTHTVLGARDGMDRKAV